MPEFVWLPVPGGEITLEDDAGTFTVQPFAISKYLVTWAQYRSFLEAKDGYRQKRWWRGLAERQAQPGEQYRQQDNHPAESVSWYDAVAFCCWLSTRLGYEVRLPTEWEWQQAATGGDPAREYPWEADWTLHTPYLGKPFGPDYRRRCVSSGCFACKGTGYEWQCVGVVSERT